MSTDTFAYEEERNELNRLLEMADELQEKFDASSNKLRKIQFTQLCLIVFMLVTLLASTTIVLLPIKISQSNTFAASVMISTILVLAYSLAFLLLLQRVSNRVSRTVLRDARALESLIKILHEYRQSMAHSAILSPLKSAELSIRLARYDYFVEGKL